EFPNSVRAALNPEEYRLIHRTEVADAEPLLASGNVDAAILDVEQEDVRSLWIIEKLRRSQPECPIIALSAPQGRDLAEEAYLQGVSYILPKPVRRRLLADILQRTLKERQATTVSRLKSPVIGMSGTPPAMQPRADAANVNSLQAFSSFSSILAGSLSIDGILRGSLQALR